MNTLAIDIGGTNFSMAVFAGERMIQRESKATDREGGKQWMMEQIVGLGRAWKSEPGFSRCGIGFGGPVIFSEQRVALSTHIGGWGDTRLSADLEAAFGVPCIMDNDANVGALGEFAHGAGIGHDPLFFMTLSTGIGGGIIQGGRVFRGADSYAGEIGHTVIDPDGPECLCGWHGCFERMCSGLWLERDYGRTARELLQDPAFVEEYVVRLAAGLKTIIMVLNPSRIVIGGGMPKAGDRLFVPLRKELRRQVTPWSRARLDVVPAQLVNDSVLYGAFALTEELNS